MWRIVNHLSKKMVFLGTCVSQPLAPVPQFLFTDSGPQFVFSCSSPLFVFTAHGRQFFVDLTLFFSFV